MEVTDTQTGIKLTAATDQDGVFTFPVLSVGQYQIDVSSDGFKPYRKIGLVIDIDSARIVEDDSTYGIYFDGIPFRDL